MIKVKATPVSGKRLICIRELGRKALTGEVFEVTEERFNELNGNNRFGLVFVEKVEEPVDECSACALPVEEVVAEPVEKPAPKKKKSTKKK